MPPRPKPPPGSKENVNEPQVRSSSSPLLNLIRDSKLLDDLQLEEVKEEHNRTGKPVSEILNDFGLIDYETQLQIIATHLGTEVIHTRQQGTDARYPRRHPGRHRPQLQVPAHRRL